MLWREISTGRWLRAIHSSCPSMLSSNTDKELLDSRSRRPPSWNGPTDSAGTYLKYSTNFTPENILETTYHIENLGEIFERSHAEQAFLRKKLRVPLNQHQNQERAPGLSRDFWRFLPWAYLYTLQDYSGLTGESRKYLQMPQRTKSTGKENFCLLFENPHL